MILYILRSSCYFRAALAQLGERQTEDLKAPCSIHGGGIYFFENHFEDDVRL